MKNFLELLTSHERFLSSYVYGLIPNSADAEDLLQEVKLALWENFSQFEVGTSFSAWSKKVAFYRVMAFRKKKAKESERLMFSDACLDLLSASFNCSNKEVSDEVYKLNKCIGSLSKTGQELIHLRYKEEFSIEEVSVRMDKSVDACYKALSRFRIQLRNCLSK